MNDLERFIAQGDYPFAVMRLECEILNGRRPPAGLIERLPDRCVRGSPLLLKAYGETLLNRGRIAEAQDVLEGAVKGFARQTFQKELLASFAMLAVVHLRIGNSHEAETILSFLKNEYFRREVPADGHVPFALAQGAHLIREEANRKAYYLAAFELFDQSGDAEYGCRALLEMLLGLGRSLDAQMLQEKRLFLLQRQKTNSVYAAYAEAFAALRDFQEERWEEAYSRLGTLNPETFPYHLAFTLRCLQARAALRCGIALAADEIVRLERDLQRYDEDALLQFQLARLKFDRSLASGDASGVRQSFIQAKSYWRLCGGMIGQNELDAMERLAEQLQSERHTGEALRWVVHCFGKMKFTRGAAEVGDIRWKRKKAQELLLYLLLQPHYAAARDQVAETLFADGDESKQANQLYVAVHQLKQIMHGYLGIEGAVVVKDGVVQIRDPVIEHVDVEKYMTLVRVGDQMWPYERELSVELYEQAVQLYDELVPEMPYIDWVERMRSHLAEMQAGVLKRLARAAAERFDFEVAESFCREWLRLFPAQEEAYQELLRVLVRQGKKAEAAEWYRRLEKICREELNTVPLPETKQILSR